MFQRFEWQPWRRSVVRKMMDRWHFEGEVGGRSRLQIYLLLTMCKYLCILLLPMYNLMFSNYFYVTYSSFIITSVFSYAYKCVFVALFGWCLNFWAQSKSNVSQPHNTSTISQWIGSTRANGPDKRNADPRNKIENITQVLICF